MLTVCAHCVYNVYERSDVMPESTINVRIDENLKTAAADIFDKLGLNMTTGINLYLKRVVSTQGIPFPLTLNRPAVLGERAYEIETNANMALQEVIDNAKENGLPVVRYDAERKCSYLEYPDGSKEYDLKKLKEIAHV